MKIDRRYLDGSHLVAVGTGVVLGSLAGYLAGRALAKRKAEEAANWRIASEVESARQHYLTRELALRKAAANAAGKGDHPDKRAAASLGDRRAGLGSGVSRTGAGFVGDDDDGAVAEISPSDIQIYPADVHPGPDSPLVGLPGTGTQDDDYSLEDDQDGGQDGTDPDDGELPVPDQSKPYVITYAEFSEEFLTARKLTVTWYQEDDTLCDERDAPFNDRVRTVGADFATYFGRDPAEPDVVYIRNRRIDIDFEIVRNEGSYAEVVLNYGKPQ